MQSQKDKIKASTQLGMNPSVASRKLQRDLLFDFLIQAGHRCYRCGGELTRETFSIEHKTSWLNADDPVGTFFNRDNVAYSHHICNARVNRGRTVNGRALTGDERVERRRARDRARDRIRGQVRDGAGTMDRMRAKMKSHPLERDTATPGSRPTGQGTGM